MTTHPLKRNPYSWERTVKPKVRNPLMIGKPRWFWTENSQDNEVTLETLEEHLTMLVGTKVATTRAEP